MKQQINLMPLPTAAAAGVTTPVVAGSCVLLAILCVALYGLKLKQVDGLSAELAAAQAREQAALAQTGAIGVTLAATDDAALAALVQSAAAALAESERVLAFLELASSGARAGFSARLAALARQSRDGLWLTRVTIGSPDGRVVLTGHARRPEMVPDYLRALSTEPAFDGQRFSHFMLERPALQNATGVEFSIRSERPERLARSGD